MVHEMWHLFANPVYLPSCLQRSCDQTEVTGGRGKGERGLKSQEVWVGSGVGGGTEVTGGLGGVWGGGWD